MGVHPDSFQWRLEPGESFQAPEVVLVCSDAGIGGMSRTFHDLFREHLIRGQKKHRPTLVNSWEACYFDFDHDKLLHLGQEAARYGVELLVVNCCSGGGRFDPGMLCYSPQIWTSDNAEAVDRLTIQEGNSLIYPLSAMGAHVAACPSHVNGRVTPFEIRGRVSLAGCFGYELDLDKLSPEEQALIPRQLEEYRQYSPVFREGDCYRLASCRENGVYDAIMAVSKNKSTAVVSFVQVKSRAYRRSLRLKPAGLDEKALYCRKNTGEVHTGAGRMRGGLLIEAVQSDYLSLLAILERVDHTGS